MADNNQRPSNSRMAKLHPKGKPRKRIWLQIIKWFFIVAMLVVVSGVGLFAYYAKTLQASPRLNFKVVVQVVCILVMENFFFLQGQKKEPMLIIMKSLKNLKMPLSLLKIGVFIKKALDSIQLELLVLSQLMLKVKAQLLVDQLLLNNQLSYRSSPLPLLKEPFVEKLKKHGFQ